MDLVVVADPHPDLVQRAPVVHDAATRLRHPVGAHERRLAQSRIQIVNQGLTIKGSKNALLPTLDGVVNISNNASLYFRHDVTVINMGNRGLTVGPGGATLDLGHGATTVTNVSFSGQITGDSSARFLDLERFPAEAGRIALPSFRAGVMNVVIAAAAAKGERHKMSTENTETKESVPVSGQPPRKTDAKERQRAARDTQRNS